MSISSKPKLASLLNIDGVAELLGTSTRPIRRLVAERRIPHHKVGGLLRFDPEAIEQWLEDHRRGPRTDQGTH